jgi:hypothetical protein
MKTLLIVAVAVMLVFVGHAALALTLENNLFVCRGELIKDHGSYSIVESWLKDTDDVYAMDCAAWTALRRSRTASSAPASSSQAQARLPMK